MQYTQMLEVALEADGVALIHSHRSCANASISLMRPQLYSLLEEIVILEVIYGV